MNKLKHEFEIGFKEGWGSFWSPFVGLCQAIAATWHRHVSGARGSASNHRHA